MRKIVIAAAMSLFVVSLATVAFADTLVMRNGSRVEGTLVSFAGRTFTFRHADGSSHRYPTSQVGSLEFFSADRANTRTARNTRPANVQRLEAPAGTELVVRTVDTIDSRNAGPDQIFSAIVEQAVTDASGRVIIPDHSSAQLMIRNVSSGGGKGATIGGLIGAAGGAATQVLTKGHHVKVPAETVLRFRLDKPVTFRVDG